VVAFIAKFIVQNVLRPLTRKTKTKADDLIIKSVRSFIFYLILLIGIKISIQTFELTSEVFHHALDSILVILLCVFVIRIIDTLSKGWLQEWASKTDSTADDRIIPLLEKILKVTVIILGVIFIFSAWEVNISPLLATAGIAGIAISFAVKDTLTNMIGGLQLVLDKTFKVGDKVELESGEMGVIQDIGLRSTKLKTYDNETIYIPNGYLANAKIKNFTQPDSSCRVNVNFGVVYGSNTEKVRQVVLDAVKEIEIVVTEPDPVVQFLEMSDYSLNFVARVWVAKWEDAYNTKLLVTDQIYRALNQAGIGIPFPTHTVYTKKMD
jgi:MscS family membrane protein